MKYFFTFFTLLLFTLCASGQELCLIAYQGTIKIGDKTCTHNLRYNLKNTNKVTFLASSRAVILNTKTHFMAEIKATEQEDYTITKFNNLLNSTKTKTGTSQKGVWAYVDRCKAYNEKQTGIKGGVAGGVKGLENGENAANVEAAFMHTDSLVYLQPSITLKWDTKIVEAGDKLVVTNNATNEVMYDKTAPKTGTATIEMATPGTYTWKIVSLFDNKYRVSYIFIRPDANGRQAILQQLEELKQDITSFSAELQELMITDYLTVNKIEE